MSTELATCRFCKQDGLLWKEIQTNRGPQRRLFSPISGLLHYCEEYKQKQNAPRDRTQFNYPLTQRIQLPNAESQQQLEEYNKSQNQQKKEMLERMAKEKQQKKEAEEREKEKHSAWNGLSRYEQLKLIVKTGMNVLLVGPSGSGKTHVAGWIANELGLDYQPTSVGPQTSKSDLIGFNTGGTGAYSTTGLRKVYELGGLFLLDELDAGNAGVLTIINAALANDVCSFPDKVIRRHENSRFMAAANTFGHGANMTYAGRNKLDGATLNRFVGVFWDYDTDYESEIGKAYPDWVEYIWALRQAAEKLDIKRIFGTRQIQQGIALLDLNVPLKQIKDMTVFFGVPKEEQKKLEANI